MNKPIFDEAILGSLNNPIHFNTMFEHLCDKYYAKVLRQVVKMVKSEEDAQDITQEIFVRIWKGISKFRGDSNLGTWIHRIAVNESIVFLNKKKRLNLESLENYHFDKVTSEIDFFPFAESIEMKFNEILSKLPQKQKWIVQKRYFEDSTFDELAKSSGTSVGALKASYHFGLKKIVNELNLM